MPAYIPFPQWIRPEIVPFLPIRWYGLMYLVAFAVAYLLFKVQLSERGLKPEKDFVTDFFFWAIVGLLVGARRFAVTISRYARISLTTLPCTSVKRKSRPCER